jgi:benzoate/toluate 1,2-dioxygenase subunit beta
MRTCSAAEIEAFLYGEARALDDQDWDTWLTFYSPDAYFWVPAWDDNDRLVENPQAEISLIYYPDRGGLEDRYSA